MNRWQYLTVTIDYESYQAQVNGQVRQVYDLVQFLDDFGREGWEMISVVQNSVQPNLWGFFFKRTMQGQF